jgi:hypothetical protein
MDKQIIKYNVYKLTFVDGVELLNACKDFKDAPYGFASENLVKIEVVQKGLSEKAVKINKQGMCYIPREWYVKHINGF